MKSLSKIKTKTIKSIAKDIKNTIPKFPKNRRKSSENLSPIMIELIQLRELLGLSRPDIADAMGRHLSQVFLMESGKTKMPSFTLLQAYAKAVGHELVMGLKKKKEK